MVAERDEVRDSTASVAILSNVGNDACECNEVNGNTLESDILTLAAGCVYIQGGVVQ